MPNEILIYDDHAEIILLNKKGKENGRASVSLNKVDMVKPYTWSKTVRGYVQAPTEYGVILLHRYITNASSENIVDHKDGNTFNNQDWNLRECSQSENMMNKRKQSNNSSGVTGVCWHKGAGKWNVRITKFKKTYNLGLYDDLNEAVRVRRDAENEHFGEFKCCNL